MYYFLMFFHFALCALGWSGEHQAVGRRPDSQYCLTCQLCDRSESTGPSFPQNSARLQWAISKSTSGLRCWKLG